MEIEHNSSYALLVKYLQNNYLISTSSLVSRISPLNIMLVSASSNSFSTDVDSTSPSSTPEAVCQ